MPGFNPENINIHDLTIEEPEKKAELYFDPETDITKDDWQHLEKSLKDVERNHWRWDNFPEFGADLKILKPDVNLHVTLDMWEHMENKLDEYRRSNHTKGEIFAAYAANMKIINPDFEIIEGDWEILHREFASTKSYKNYPHMAYVAADMKILNPGIILDLGPDFWEGIRESMHGYTTLPLFLGEAYSVKILDPTFDLDLKQENAKGLRELLQARRDQNEWEHFAKLAAQAKVITADEVKVTDEGFEVNMHKPNLKPEPKDLPEQRKF